MYHTALGPRPLLRARKLDAQQAELIARQVADVFDGAAPLLKFGMSKRMQRIVFGRRVQLDLVDQGPSSSEALRKQQDPSAPAARSRERCGTRSGAASDHDARPHATGARDRPVHLGDEPERWRAKKSAINFPPTGTWRRNVTPSCRAFSPTRDKLLMP
jgi:hypothetical protein